MDKHGLTVAIIVKNASASIRKSLNSVRFADEIIIVDDHSEDDTVKICKEFTDKVYPTNQLNFAAKRNKILEEVVTDWILYIDADEVVTTNLAKEISAIVSQNDPGAYKVIRENYFLGTKMYPDQVERLFHRSVIKEWTGAVHESPTLTCPAKALKSPLLHFTHTDITSMLQKTNQWSDIEADLRLKADHPPMAWWRLIRIALSVGWHQWVTLRVGAFGRAGLFEGYFQVVDKLIVYTKLWEKQQTS